MADSFLEALEKSILIADGGMGTMLYSRGIFINRSFDELNVSMPGLVREIHWEYIQAGADIIETNTFAANSFKLEPHGLEGKVYEINLEGAHLARKEAEKAHRRVFVAGAMGPLKLPPEPFGHISPEDVRRSFREQAEGLIDGGVDLFVLESFSSLNEIHQAIIAIREASEHLGYTPPIIAQMTFGDDGNTLYGAKPEKVARVLEGWEVDVIGANCSIGPQPMLDSISAMATVTNRPLSAMPNAGLPKLVDERYIYMTSPEYLGKYAKRFIKAGCRIVGGCCGTTPEHIKAVATELAALRPAVSRLFHIPKPEHITVEDTQPVVEPVPKAQKSELARKLSEGKFVSSVELLPPRGTNYDRVIKAATRLKEHGVDCINIPDGARAVARMSPQAMALLIRQQVEIEPIIHYCCRDRNLLGMQSDLIGAHALNIRNILVITGDPPKMGDYPDATAVYDVDSIGLTRIITNLNHGCDLVGNPVGEPTAIHVGVGANPGAINFEEEVRRFELKAEAGAEYAMTQPVFDVRILEKFIKRVEHLNIPILVGILPLTSYKRAEFFHNEVPGMSVPENIREKLAAAKREKEAKEIGIQLAQEALLAAKPMVQGVYVMPVAGGSRLAVRVLEVLT